MKKNENPLPLWVPNITKEGAPEIVQTTTAERIGSLLGYTITNPLCIEFINKYGHPDQLKRDDDGPPTENMKPLRIAEITEFESRFVDRNFYNAACIAMEREIREREIREREINETPKIRGFNIPSITEAALAIIKESQQEEPPPFQQIGYHG